MISKPIDTILLAAFCGTGKTYLCKKSPNKVIEIEYWKYKESGLQKDYLSEIEKYFGQVEYILIATDPEGIRLLKNKGYEIILVYPKNELRNEYLDRYLNRDSPQDFIGAMMKYWHPWLNELKELTDCQHIILNEGQYLQDILGELK